MGSIETISAQVTELIGSIASRVRALVGIAVVAIVAGLIWVLVTTEAHANNTIIVLPMAAFLGFAILLLAIASFVQIRVTTEHSVAPTAGEFVVGCLLGRQTVAAGMLRIRGHAGRTVPSAANVSVFVEHISIRLPRAFRNSRQLCDELAKLILQVLEESKKKTGFTRCDAIGIATPGIIDPRTGQLNISVTLPEGTDIPRELARRLLAKDPLLSRFVYRRIADSEQALARHILIDNDVRCIARHVLSQHQWDQFTCLYAASGVGGAFVVNGQVYYGAHGSASHIGHLELEAPTGQLVLATGQSLGPIECDCGISGFHLDAFANYQGFRRIAERIAADDQHGLLAVIKRAQDSSGLAEDDFYREVFLEIVTAAGSRVPTNLPPDILKALADPMQLERLARDVLRSYVGILVSGLSTLTHMFDPGIIVICGSLIERLQENDLFARFLRESLPAHLVDSRARPQLASAVASDAFWQGAALLAWDMAYQRNHIYLSA